MKLNPIGLGMASAIATAILWVICSVFVVLFPGFAESMTAGMMHSDTASISLTMAWTGVLWGLIGWTVFAGVFGWLIAIIYNRLLSK